jgi:hypothetical protein
MAKNTRPLSGQMKRKYFRDLFRAEAGVTADAAERLTDLCDRELAEVRARLPLVVRRPMKPTEIKIGAVETSRPEASVAPEVAAFDPHAFSLIVEWRKGGASGLAGKLAMLSSADHLRAMAHAQHVSLGDTAEDRTALIAAIVAGTERRVAHMKAAAS